MQLVLMALRCRMRVAYDGTHFAGWQLQPRCRTVQGVLEKTLARRFGGQRVPLLGASRTDAGVHARGNAAHFDLPVMPDLDLLERQLNRMLPPDVAVSELQPAVPEPWQAEQGLEWHAIVNSVGKRYVYRLTKRQDPFERLYRARVAHEPINLGRLDAALRLFVGHHDFRAFGNYANGQHPDRSTLRTVDATYLVDEGDGDASVVVDLDGALYKMVRNIVGTAIAVARVRLALMLCDSATRRTTLTSTLSRSSCKGAAIGPTILQRPRRPTA